MDDVIFEKHYRATRDLAITLKAARREHVDGGHLPGEARSRSDGFNQAAGSTLTVLAGHVVRLSEAEAAPHLEAGDLIPAP